MIRKLEQSVALRSAESSMSASVAFMPSPKLKKDFSTVTKRFGLIATVMAFLFIAAPGFLMATSPDVIYYIDSGNNVDELRFNGSSWAFTNLMNVTGATYSSPDSGLTGHLYGSSDNVYYVGGTDSHIHELAYYGSPASWHASDVTYAAGGPEAFGNSPLTSHTAGSSYDDVYYIAIDNDIHELAFNGSSWADTDITVASGASGPSTAAGQLFSVVFSAQDREDTFFIGANQTVNRISFDDVNSTWSSTDLTAACGDYSPNDESDVLAVIYGGSEDVYYVGTNGDLLSYGYDDNSPCGYVDWDITSLAGSPQPTSNSALTGYQNGSYFDLYFFTSTPDVYMDWYNTTEWLPANITSLSGGSGPDTSRAMSGHMWENTTPEVFSFLSNGDVYENAFYSNSWHATDISSIVSAPAAESGSPIIGFTGI